MVTEDFNGLQRTLFHRMRELAAYLTKYETAVSKLLEKMKNYDANTSDTQPAALRLDTTAPQRPGIDDLFCATHGIFCKIDDRLTRALAVHSNASRVHLGDQTDERWIFHFLRPTNIKATIALIDAVEQDILAVVKSYLDVAALGRPLQVGVHRFPLAALH